MENNEELLYHLFMRTIRLHYHLAHAEFEKDGIYPGQPPLLALLGHCGGKSQKELANKLKIAPATINVMIKRMEKTGLLERKQDEEDQRVSRIYLTDKGQVAYQRVDETTKQINDKCFANFTLEEKILLRRLLMQMIDNLKESLQEIDNRDRS